MRTPEELASTIYNGFMSDNGYREDVTVEALQEVCYRYTAEIRKDQDKITRHACAESIELVNPQCMECGGVDLERAHQAIMNTKFS